MEVLQSGLGKSEDMTGDVDMMSNGERECEVHRLEEDYTNRAIMAGQDLINKQKMQLMQLMQLLKQVEGSVNSSQNSMFQTIDNHKDSLRSFLQKAVSYVSTIQQSSHDEHAFDITLKLLKAIYDHVCEILSSVEGGVDNLINRLAEQMCQPMMEYVKSCKAEMTTGTCPRLVGTLENIRKVTRDGRLELEQARKKVRLAEERKLEALSKLKDSEEKLKKMRQYVGFSINDKKESTGHYSKNKLAAPVEDQAKEDKLLWELLKKKQTSQQPQSPFGSKALIPVGTSTKHYMPTMGQPSITRIPTTRVYGRQNPQPLNSLLQLGSSPSVAAYQVLSRKC